MPYVFNPEMDAVMAGMPFGFFRADLHANVVHSNGYLERTHGLTYEQFEGNAWQELLHPDDKNQLLMLFAKDFFLNKVTFAAVRLILPGKKTLPILYLIDTLVDQEGKRIGFIVNVVDVSLALHELCGDVISNRLDPLTQVLIRVDFLKKLNEALVAKKNHSHFSALIVIDIKGLQKFNELWGYSLGDELLTKLAEILKNFINERYVIGRLESAKFSVIVDSIESLEQLKEFVLELYTQCNHSIVLPQASFTLEVSVGVSITTLTDGEIDPILRHGLEALKIAKNKSPRIEFLDEREHRDYRRSAQIASYLFDAISQDQFEMHYQPQMNMVTHKLAGVEALLRWRHPELGIIEPEEFIPIAEESGFVVHVGKWVMDHAIKQYQIWHKKFEEKLDAVPLSINLSPLQLQDQNLISDLNQILKKYQMKATNLIFELTEHLVMTNPQANVQVMNQIRELGVNFSLDDFGVGYSSLNYIRYLPIHQIKIDRTFVKAFEYSRQDAAVVKATLSLAQALGIDVVAEGVETLNEIDFLRDNGCKLAQGFYYSHPLNAKGMEEYIESNL